MGLKGFGKSISKGFNKTTKSISKGAKKTFKPAVINDIGNTIGKGISGAAGGVKDSFDNLVNTAGTTVAGLGENLEGTFSNPLLIIGGVVVVGVIAYVVMSNR